MEVIDRRSSLMLDNSLMAITRIFQPQDWWLAHLYVFCKGGDSCRGWPTRYNCVHCDASSGELSLAQAFWPAPFLLPEHFQDWYSLHETRGPSTPVGMTICNELQ